MFPNPQPEAITTQTVYTAYIVFIMTWPTFVKYFSGRNTLSVLLQSNEILGRIFRLHWSNKFNWAVYIWTLDRKVSRVLCIIHDGQKERENTEHCLKGPHLCCTFGPPAPRSMSSSVSQPDPTTLLIAAESLQLAGMLAEPWQTPLCLLRGFNITLIFRTMPMWDSPSLFMPLIWFQAFSRWLGDRSHGGLKQWQKLKTKKFSKFFNKYIFCFRDWKTKKLTVQWQLS